MSDNYPTRTFTILEAQSTNDEHDIIANNNDTEVTWGIVSIQTWFSLMKQHHGGA